MSILAGFFNTLGRIKPISVNTNWGTDTAVSPIISATRTMTVPAGNPGTIRFVINNNTATGKYSKNAGAFTAITDGMTLAVATSDTIALRAAGAVADVFDVSILDNTTSQSVGTWVATCA